MTILSVLDQSPIRSGHTPAEAIAESIELAKACERWGYHRYWVAEHHSSEGLAGAAPEILVARLGAATSTMRIGTGGVMLSHYSPLKVAEQFRMLETLYPGRIDLGLGRAPGSDYVTSRALAHGPGALGIEEFPRQIQDLFAYLRDAIPDGHPFAGVSAQPRGATLPEPWLLGSSDQSAAYAAYFGCAFSFAHFITERMGPEIMAAYRRQFQPSPWYAKPQGSIGVAVICADSNEEADRLAKSRDLSRLRMEQGILGPVPTVEEAERYSYSHEERLRVAFNRQRQVIGDPATCKEKLLALAATYGVDEIVIVTITHDVAARFKSYELLARAFALGQRA
jgi:luciferase family oxidoreductase group 1